MGAKPIWIVKNELWFLSFEYVQNRLLGVTHTDWVHVRSYSPNPSSIITTEVNMS